VTAQVPRVISSGWWVAVAAVVVSLAMILIAIVGSDPHPTSTGDGRAVASYGFDLTQTIVPREKIIASGMPRDGLAALDDPEMLDLGEVDLRGSEGRGKFLVSNDRVVGLSIAGDARAYPLRFLRWHEVVNDTVGGVAVVVSYNPLCDSVVVADRRVGGEVLDFGISGLLLNSNLLMYDRQEDIGNSSLWSQLGAQAISGPMTGSRLRLLPAALASWGDWRAVHPDTLVLAPLDRLQSVYKRDPYHSYFGSDLLRFPVSPLPPAGDLRFKDRVVVLDIGDARTVLALTRIASAAGSNDGTWTVTVGETPVAIDFNAKLGTAVAHTAPGVDPGIRHAFWFAWYAAHPETADPLPNLPPPTH
jgi:hypothetical protein